MVSAPVKNMSGADVGTYEFDGAELADRISKQLLHDVVVMYEANRRQGTAKTKTRGEVAGTSKKLFRQKGTGNARMGTKRSPIRRGGGHTFAKRTRDWGYRLPKKAIKVATRMALLSKFQDAEAIVLDGLNVTAIKTKPIFQMIQDLGVGGQSTLFVTKDMDQNLWRSARNIDGVWVSPARNLNAYDLLHQRRLVITREAIDAIRDGSLWASDAE
ncbi:MAG: 50S ribosomal protein L4 [Planctomycetaceae bacterium]|nr:50S ribosomal protein L4 [Planctomycetaceae bacterium]